MTRTEPAAAGRLPRFLLVGTLAAAVHWATANLLMLGDMAPLRANVGGFALAFVVSYLGQRHWTFGAGHLAHRHTLPRYLLLACSGFAANEALFYPINPGAEDASWRRLFDEGIDRFLGGSYAGEYQKKLLAEFDTYLPDTPPWK